MEGWNFWWGVAAFFLGGLATQLNGWLAYRRQRKDRADDAADSLRQRREEFELQHLVEVNQLLHDATTRLLDYQLSVVRYQDAQQGSRLTAELEEDRAATGAAAADALSALVAQMGFILDDAVRQAAETAIELMARSSALLAASAQVDVSEIASAAETVHEPLGARVRQIYAGHSMS